MPLPSTTVAITNLVPVPRGQHESLLTGQIRLAAIDALFRRGAEQTVHIVLGNGQAYDAPIDGGQNAALLALLS